MQDEGLSGSIALPMMLRLTLTLLTLFAGPPWASAAVIPVPGGKFVVNRKDGDALLPLHWRVVRKGAREVWMAGQRHGLLLKRGAAIETTVMVPALGEKEAGLKGDWSGIAHLDYWGVDGEGPGLLRFQVLVDGKTIGSRSVGVGKPVVPRGKDVQAEDLIDLRTWATVKSERFSEVLGQEVNLRIVNEGPRGVIVTGVGFCRVLDNQTGKVLGKPNGHLGPDLIGAGSLGFEAIAVHKQQALQILRVREGGPAAEAGLASGDVIVSINRRPLPANDVAPGWNWFEQSHEALLGRAVLGSAEREGVVELALLRGHDLLRPKLKLERAMNFNSMIPMDDEVAAALHEDTLGFLIRTQREDGSWSGDPIRTTFSALALLATRDATHAVRIKRAVDYLLNRYPEAERFGGLGFWHAAYTGILFSEYQLATGDDRVMQRLRDIRDWVLTGTHTSKWGMPALGHGVGHLPYGQKALMAPLSHLIVYEALAQRLGMESQIWEELGPFIEHSWSDPEKIAGKRPGHGAMGYNASYKDLQEFWSRTGLCAMACELRGEKPKMRDALTKIMRERHPWIRNSHAYGEPGGSWGLLGLNLAAPEAYREVIQAYGWWFALAWEPGYGLRFTQPHMGAPYMGKDDLINATYALVLAAPKKSLHLTGARDRDWLDVSKLPTRLTEVRVKRDKDGMVTLEGRIPGPEIVYTLDGTAPEAEGLRYEKPFLLGRAATLQAKTHQGEDWGPLSKVEFAPAKKNFQIVSASGHAKVGQALRRADRLIDGDLNKCWLTDNGEDSKGYPHHFVLDLGEVSELKGLKLHFAEKGKTPGKWSVSTSLTAAGKPLTVADGQWTSHATSRAIDFGEIVKARFVRFDAVEGVTPEANTLMIREVEVVR